MLYQLKGKKPEIAENVFIAPGSQIIGDVVIEKDSSIWFNAVLRGDDASITIGKKTNIQENASLHIDIGQPLILGNNITVGHSAVVHGCTIEDNCLIGMGAIILNAAFIGKNSIIGAGTLIPQGKKIPPRSLVIGVPGKVIRKLTDEEVESLKRSAEHYYQTAMAYHEDLKEIED